MTLLTWRAVVMCLLTASAWTFDSIDVMQMKVAPETSDELVSAIVNAARAKTQQGADLVLTTKTAAHAAADAIKQLDGDEKPADALVTEEISTAREVIVQLMSHHSRVDGRFILVTGSENSGTTMVARIIANLATARAFTTNWRRGELSAEAQARYEGIANFNKIEGSFNIAMKKLWSDDEESYAKSQRDTRNSTEVQNLLSVASQQIQALIDSQPNEIKQVVYHRSMPFDNKFHTPHFEDLPLIAERLQSNWGARAVIVLRQVPTMWASHIGASQDRFEPYFNQIEGLLARCCPTEGEMCSRESSCPLFLRYERVLDNPSDELRCLLGEAIGFDENDLAQLLASPELSRGSVFGHSEGYDKIIDRNERVWQKEYKSKFPVFERVTSQQGHL